jgi:copper oxidase (laccase) domain-containing protein
MTSATACPYETFPALESLPVIHAFTGRVPGLDVRIDRAAALGRLNVHHEEVRSHIGAGGHHFATAEQVHGAGISVVRSPADAPSPGADGLITDDPRICLGIYVADCGPVWLVDPVRRAIGCVHSGRKGTELGIVTAAIEAMVENFGCEPSSIVAQLGPCIRPPHYEIDFAADILRQCRAAGLGRVHDSGRCTAVEGQRYYSYRREKGQTGRMLALLALA